MIARISELFAQYYVDQTIEDGKVVQLNARPQPKSFESLMISTYASEKLPIRPFAIQPEFDEPTPDCQSDRLRSRDDSDKTEVNLGVGFNFGPKVTIQMALPTTCTDPVLDGDQALHRDPSDLGDREPKWCHNSWPAGGPVHWRGPRRRPRSYANFLVHS